jgi:hypothetical protein
MIRNKEAIELIEKVNLAYNVDIISRERDRHTSDIRKMYCSFVYNNTRLTIQNLSEILQKSIGNVSYYLSTHDSQMKLGGAYADHFTEFQDRMKIESAKI